MKIKFAWVLFFIFFSTAVASGQKILRVGTPGDYTPFSLFNAATQTYAGMDIDLIQDFAKSNGFKIKYVKTSWPTLMGDYHEGKFDIAVGGISKTPEREQVAVFSGGYLKSGKTPIARCTDKRKFDSLKEIDRSGVRLIVNPGGTNQKFIANHIRRARVIVFQDNTAIFDQIVAGKADVMITDSVEVALQSKSHPELCPTMPGRTFDHYEKAIMLSHDPVLKQKVDDWLAALQSQGKLDAIINMYLPADPL